jgi:DNA polymerase-3 subunit beta
MPEMKFVIQKSDLVSGLQRIQNIVQSRSTMPILSNVRLETDKDGIQLFATDLEIGLQDRIPAEIQESGKITVSARKFYEIAKELKEEQIRVESKNHQQIVIHSGKSSFKLRGLSAEEYPSFPEIKETGKITLPSGLLLEMIKKTSYAVSSDLTRLSLNGVLLHLPANRKKSIEMVATDGHRLSMVERKLPSGKESKQGIKVIVPKKAINELKKYLDDGDHGDLEIIISENHIAFQEGSYILLSRLIDAKFPNYEDVIPKENPNSLILSRELFQGVIRRVSILSDEKTNAIQLSLRKGELLVSSNNPEIGEASESLPTDYQDADIDVGFNVRYMQDITSAFQGEEVRILLGDPLSPTRIEDPSDQGFLGVIMPMRI